MKPSLKWISTFLGITVLAAVMVFSIASCQQEPDPDPEVPTTLQKTVWTDPSENQLAFTKTDVTIYTPSGQQQFKVKNTVKNGQNTTLFFTNSKENDYIVCGDSSVIEVNLGSLQQSGEWNKENSDWDAPEIQFTLSAINDPETGSTTGILITFDRPINHVNLTVKNTNVGSSAEKMSSTKLTGFGSTWTLSPIHVIRTGAASVWFNNVQGAAFGSARSVPVQQ